MKKYSFTRAKSYRCKTRSMQHYIKYLKRLRSKRARKNIDEWHKTNAWDAAKLPLITINNILTL